MAPDRKRRSGFTLFEILGAVTILAVVYSWLATSAMQGMRSEGLSKRRLEASLLIDQELMEIETAIATGTTPEVGRTERELDGEYRLVTEVTPFDPTPYLGEDFPPEGATTTLLLPPERAEDAFLRLVDLTVSWDDGADEREVRRTTLAYDLETVAELFPDTAAEEGEEEEDGADALEQFLNPDGTPNFQRMLESLGQ